MSRLGRRAGLLGWCAQRKAQCMQPALELRRQRARDQAMARYPGQAGEPVGDDQHAVMRLPPRRGTRMPGVLGTVIHDFDPKRRQVLGQDGVHPVGAGLCHGLR